MVEAGSFSYQAVNDLLAQLRAVKAALAMREEELIQIRGVCRNPTCRLHYAHSGPCALKPKESNA